MLPAGLRGVCDEFKVKEVSASIQNKKGKLRCVCVFEWLLVNVFQCDKFWPVAVNITITLTNDIITAIVTDSISISIRNKYD